MRYLDIGTSKRISKIGLGTYQFGSPEWHYGDWYADSEARAIVHRALDLGVTLFDTAEIYGFRAHRIARRAVLEGVALSDVARIPGFGRSERILGDALGEMRESAFLATKLYPAAPTVPVPEQRAIASANRLGTGRLDLYQVHQPSRMVPPSRVMRGIRALQEAGVVGEVGVSNASLERWRTAERVLGRRIVSNQVGYSLVTRSAERELLPFAESHGRVIIAYRPLELGLLAGRYDCDHRPADPVRAGYPLFQPQNLERARGLIGTLREVADAHAATPAQVALAWVIRHPAVVAIPGASSVEQLENNVAATEIDLAQDEYRALQAASSRFRPVPGPGFLSRQLKALGVPGRARGPAGT
ncbi:MAG TPA: aldo/keto reductase [Streptosporangiaceae bacterium]|nr:aldo/keto reductase [Streptosporangiaceae bacterium]